MFDVNWKSDLCPSSYVETHFQPLLIEALMFVQCHARFFFHINEFPTRNQTPIDFLYFLPCKEMRVAYSFYMMKVFQRWNTNHINGPYIEKGMAVKMVLIKSFFKVASLFYSPTLCIPITSKCRIKRF